MVLKAVRSKNAPEGPSQVSRRPAAFRAYIARCADPMTQPPSRSPSPLPAASPSDEPLEPRAAVSPGITRRGVLIGVLIGIVAVLAALLSVYARRTRLERTTEFWGRPVIRALQSSAHIRMRVPPGGALAIPSQNGDDAVELGDVPGVAYLRNALLDERHFRWETLQSVPVETAVEQALQVDSADDGDRAAVAPEWVILELEGTPPGVQNDPDGKIQPVTIRLELSTGWVGLADGDRSVRMTRRARPAVRHFLLRMINVQSQRYDDRSASERGS